tara:strand:+ start:96 stop:317 length:222 start_codon:yes stop_codon:yes gene_type:complete
LTTIESADPVLTGKLVQEHLRQNESLSGDAFVTSTTDFCNVRKYLNLGIFFAGLGEILGEKRFITTSENNRLL